MLEDLLLEGALHASEEVSFDEEELLLLLGVFGDDLGGDEAGPAEVHQLSFEDVLQAVLGYSVGFHELPPVLAAPDHLRVEDVGLDVGVVLEDVVAVDEDERPQLHLLCGGGERLVDVERLQLLDHLHAVELPGAHELRPRSVQVR